jgi:putative tricarboxylic transport membrane protein
MALLLPFTFGLSPEASLIMLAGIYYGAMYGGSTTSILLRIPGEVASMVTCFDGYEMARKGRAGAALATAAIGSWIAGTVCVFGLMFTAPPLADFALRFGPAEYCGVALLGLLLLNNLSGDSFLKATLMLVIGLMISTVGMDMLTGHDRFTFGSDFLRDGLGLVPVLMGVFGVSEILLLVSRQEKAVTKLLKVRFKELYPKLEEMKKTIMPIIRGTILGFPVGLLPGPGHVIATLLSYKVEMKLSRHPEQFGKGAIEGVAGPETANNAASVGALIPLVSLGLPFAPVTAILLGALLIHGIAPSPLFISSHADIFWTFVASMYIGNLMLLILNLPLVGVFATLIKAPIKILMPIVLTMMLIGTYSIRYSVYDLLVLIIAGGAGYIMRKADYSPVPLIVGTVLGPMFERSLRQALLISAGSYWSLFQRPIMAVLLIFIILVIFWGIGGKYIKGAALKLIQRR